MSELRHIRVVYHIRNVLTFNIKELDMQRTALVTSVYTGVDFWGICQI